MRINTKKSLDRRGWACLFFGNNASFFDMNSSTDAKKYASILRTIRNDANKIVRRITPYEYEEIVADHIPCCERCGFSMQDFNIEFDPVKRIHYRQLTTLLVCPICGQRKVERSK